MTDNPSRPFPVRFIHSCFRPAVRIFGDAIVCHIGIQEQVSVDQKAQPTLVQLVRRCIVQSTDPWLYVNCTDAIDVVY